MNRKDARFLLSEPKRLLVSRELKFCSVFQEFIYRPRLGHRVIGRRKVGGDQIRYAWIHSCHLKIAEMSFRNDQLRMVRTEKRLTVKMKSATWRFMRAFSRGNEIISCEKDGYSLRLENPRSAVSLDQGPELVIQSEDGHSWGMQTSWRFSSDLEVRHEGSESVPLPSEIRTLAIALLNFFSGGA